MTKSNVFRDKDETVTDFWILAILIMFSAALSWFIFSEQSIRLDEAQSLWQTSHSPQAMIHIVAEDVHVPLYHLMLHYWQIFFGNSAAVVRSLSLLFYLAIIPGIYFLGKKCYGRKVGIYAAILVSFSPFLNWYGNEVRMYSLFALLTIINAYFFTSLFHKRESNEEGRKGDREVEVGSSATTIWAGYIITAILGIFTHYFFAFNLITHAIFYFIYAKNFSKGSFFGLSATAVLLLILYSPWMYYVVELGLANNTQPHLTAPSTVDLFNTFSQFMFGFQNNIVNTILVSLWPILVLFIFLAVQRNKKVSPVTVFMFFSLVIPIALAFIVSEIYKPIYVTRYLIIALPPLFLLVSWVISLYPPRLSRFMKVTVVTMMVATLVVQIASADTPVKEDYRAASDYLTKHAAVQDVIIVSAPFTIYPFVYYYKGASQVETLPMWDRLQTGSIPAFDEAKLPQEVDLIKKDHEVVWVLLSYDQGYEERIRLYFDTNYARLAAINFSPNLNLYAYRVEYNHSSDSDFNFPIPRASGVSK